MYIWQAHSVSKEGNSLASYASRRPVVRTAHSLATLEHKFLMLSQQSRFDSIKFLSIFRSNTIEDNKIRNV